MEEKTTKKLIPLEKYTDTYKLIIPIEVERKIRHLCSKISDVEWSGTLFYTCSGSYEDKTLEITCVDIFPMDIGSATYTEFDMSPDVVAYMTSHPELLDCQIGLVHSHASMSTFFSSTDTSTLREEGNDRNHFVSLIVNNAGTYTAAITRKLSIKKNVTSTYTYKSFDDIEKEGTYTFETEEEIIAYSFLDIIKEGTIVEPFQEIDQRLKAIKENKTKKSYITSNDMDRWYSSDWSPTYDRSKSAYNSIQPSLFDKKVPSFSTNKQITDIDKLNIIIPDSTVRSITLQLITGSIAIADASRIDPNKWANQMTKLFDRRFNNDISTFKLWTEVFVEFVVANFIPERYALCEEEYISELSERVYNILDKLPSNKYIKAIQDTLITWMK